MKLLHVVSLAVLAVGAWIGAAQAVEQWKTFRSSESGYTVTYPGSWHLGASASQFVISNFPASRAVHSVGIPPGGAMISVVAASGAVYDVAGWIKNDEDRGDLVLDSRDLPVAAAAIGACTRLTQVETTVDVTVPPLEVTSLYCEARGGPYRITLENYKGDSKQRQYQDIAFKIAQSLRVAESAK